MDNIPIFLPPQQEANLKKISANGKKIKINNGELNNIKLKNY